MSARSAPSPRAGNRQLTAVCMGPLTFSAVAHLESGRVLDYSGRTAEKGKGYLHARFAVRRCPAVVRRRALWCRHPDFVEARLGDGLHAAFRLAAGLPGGGPGLGGVYALCRGTKGGRNKVLHSLVHKFDTAADDLPFLQ